MSADLIVLGKKADLKYEKKLEINYRKIRSTFLLQRVWRGYKSRKCTKQIR